VAATLAGGAWTATVPVPWNGKVIYKFHIVYQNNTEKYLPDPGNPVQVDDGFGGKNSQLSTATCMDYTCASAQIVCPGGAVGGFDWRDATMYFVFVDRFLNGSNANDKPLNPASGVSQPANWQGGDWAGVRAKIDDGYFASLGINTLWLSVPMDNSESPGIGDDGMTYSAYHGYWPRDLSTPEARFGTAVELKALVDAAHASGIKVLIDYAMNHVHKDSPTYQAHMNDGWFNPLMQANQQCVCGTGACQYDGAYAKTCWFRDYLPDFNFNNAAARAFSTDNAIKWITDYGFDGFRLDAVKHIELSWLTDLRTKLTQTVEPTSKQHVYLVGETFTGDQALLKSFVNPCTMLDGQFDFPMRATVNSILLMRQGVMKTLIDFMDSNDGKYGVSVMSTFLGNHDVPRTIHFAEDAPLWSDPWANGKDRNWSNTPNAPSGTSAYERMALGFALIYTNRGVPLVYYGDEIGLPGAGDPDNRRFMPWTTPTGGPALLKAKLQKLGALRAGHSSLRRGTRATLSYDNDSWAYSMTDGSDVVYVAMNRSDAAKNVGGLPGKALKDEMTGDMVTGPTVSVPARSFRIFIGP
jgi:glycosidase